MALKSKGRADFLDLGSWNAVCYFCGRKRKASEMKKQWQGYFVCPEEWEPRPAQDFVRGIPDEMAPPWTQPPPADVFTGPQCTLLGTQAIPGLAVPSCVLPSTFNPVVVFNGTGVI